MNNCGCGCGCKVQLTVEEECPITLQIIDGETVRMGCADFLIRTDKDYNHLENKPSINDVTLEGNKTLEELGIDLDAKLDKPPETGVGNGLLRNNNGGDPSWTVGASIFEQVPNGSGGVGYAQLTLGNAEDYRTPPYGRYGTLRLIMTDGDKRGITVFGVAPPLVNGEKRAYYFLESNHAQTNNYMLSSANRNNTAGKLAVFTEGSSIASGTLSESDIELKANKVTSLSSSSTDTEYPSAKAVYDAIQGGGSAKTRHLTLALDDGTYYLEDENGARLTPEAFEDISIGDTDISTASLVSKDYYQVVYSNVQLRLTGKTYTLILANISDASTPRARLITLTSQGDDVVYTGTTAEDYPLLDDADYAKLSGIEDGAEVNTIDTVKVNGTALTPDENKAVDISVPTKTSDLINDGADNTSTYLEADETAYRASGIPFGKCAGTSTATALTATVPGITELRDGVCMWLRNGAINSAANFTLNINSLGAKPVYSNLADATRESTLFNKGYTFFFVYDETRVSGGCWVLDRGYDSNTNTIGYQLRTNSSILQTADAMRYYKLLFTSADGTKWVPGSSSTTNSATSAKTVNQRPIDPFGTIVYLANTTNYAANADVPAASIWQQYVFALGYTFNRTGAALAMTTKRPVYVKCAPQADGSAVIDSDNPFVQALPSTADGKIYIFLGIAYSATNIELQMTHPVYYYKDGAIREWTGVAVPTKTSELTNDAGFLTLADLPVWDGGVE